MSDRHNYAEWYDRIYQNMSKDYGAEASMVDALASAHNPRAHSLLDMACGTGLHLQSLSEHYDVSGFDIEPAYVRKARERCPGARLQVADLRTFNFKQRFDVITCLFSAIGYLKTVDDLKITLTKVSEHLTPNGVALIEPWMDAADLKDGLYGVEISEGVTSTLIRASHSRVTVKQPHVTELSFEWIEVSRSGLTKLQERHFLRSFTHQEFFAAFDAAGLSARFDEQGVNDLGRGLWIATKK